MRITPLFAFILVSISLLSESYHYAGAIGINSASHGILRGGRVVRRYGVSGGTLRALKKRQQQQQQQQQEQDNPPTTSTRGGGRNKVKNGGGNRGNRAQQQNDVKAPVQQAPVQQEPPQQAPPQQASPAAPTTTTTPTPKKGKFNQGNQDDATDTTIRPPGGGQQQNQQNTLDPEQSDSQPNAQAGMPPMVNTNSISAPVVGGLVSVGGVFVLVGGLFAFSQRRKNKEIVKNIVSNSSKAWEQQQQQNSVYEVMEEETKPIGTYTVVAIYTPTLSDELEIQLGDQVSVLVEYDDGWVQGINETRGGTKGVFPRHCVDMDNIDTSNKTKNIKRSSSMGVYAEGYTEVDLN